MSKPKTVPAASSVPLENFLKLPHPVLVGDLVRWGEPERRRLLRPHWEDIDGTTTDQGIKVQEEFGEVLVFLLGLELMRSTGFDIRRIGGAVGQPLKQLLGESPAVARFICAYDYVGIRFLAEHLGIELSGLAPLQGPDPTQATQADVMDFLDNARADAEDIHVKRFLGVLEGHTTANLRINKALFEERLKDPSRSDPDGIFEATRLAGIKWCTNRTKLYKGRSDALKARFAIHDLYWILKLFGTDSSKSGLVTFSSENWFEKLGGSDQERNLLIEAREILSNAWGLANTVANRTTMSWKEAYLEELQAVAKLRSRRDSAKLADPVPLGEAVKAGDKLVGLAFSGGGIRSATFNLGVLEGLKKCGLLPRIDYLSTVSGGGYIGSWLIANTFRRPSWLSEDANWRSSIEYLRKHSNYLSPQLGLLSADTWNIAAIWSRNTFLIQVLVFLMIAAVLLVPHALELLFDLSAQPSLPMLTLTAVPLLVGGCGILWNLAALKTRLPPGKIGPPTGQAGTQGLIVVPLFVASFLLAAMLWGQACDWIGFSYGGIVSQAFRRWWPVIALIGVLTLGMSFFTSAGSSRFIRWVGALGCAAVTVAVLYAAVCGVQLLMSQWNEAKLGWSGAPWYAATFGPALVLLSFTFCIMVMLGLLSRISDEDKREWWSRLGAWQGIYSAAFLVVAIAGIFSPMWLAMAAGRWKLTAGALGWAATTLGGLLAGKSGDTGGMGAKGDRARANGLLAVIAPVVFIAGLVVGLSSALHAVLLYATDNWPRNFLGQYWERFGQISWESVVITLGILLCMTVVYSLALDINVFSLNAFYRNRLVRCYLGATRDEPERHPQRFTQFDEGDDLVLREILPGISPQTPYTGPLPIVNCALNLGGSTDLKLHTRHSDSFTFTPLHAGSWRPVVQFAPLTLNGKPHYGGGRGTPRLGEVVSVSGAAASPNMGYHTSALVAFLLTVFNVRLGWWHPNPSGKRVGQRSAWFSFMPLIQEMFGSAKEDKGFLNLSDGGHFENLGIYELVRRRCLVIIAADGEADPGLTFGGLGSVIRMCDADFGAKITIDVASIRKEKGSEYSSSHCAIGTIDYDNGTRGYLIYMKASLIGDEDTEVLQYKSSHPDFPHQTTADQFFTDDQFESYQTLGRSIACRTFRDIKDKRSLIAVAKELESLWTPRLHDQDKFVVQTEALSKLWSQLKADDTVRNLGYEMHGGKAGATDDEMRNFFLSNEAFQLMENTYLDLHLDETWEHPDNAGWKELFLRWSRSEAVKNAWLESRATYGNRFRKFCERKLKLPAGLD